MSEKATRKGYNPPPDDDVKPEWTPLPPTVGRIEFGPKYGGGGVSITYKEIADAFRKEGNDYLADQLEARIRAIEDAMLWRNAKIRFMRVVLECSCDGATIEFAAGGKTTCPSCHRTYRLRYSVEVKG